MVVEASVLVPHHQENAVLPDRRPAQRRVDIANKRVTRTGRTTGVHGVTGREVEVRDGLQRVIRLDERVPRGVALRGDQVIRESVITVRPVRRLARRVVPEVCLALVVLIDHSWER